MDRQNDDWHCRYIVLWWQIFPYFYFKATPSFDSFDPQCLPTIPPQWEQLIWLLLRARDAQKMMLKGHAHTFSLQTVFKETLDGHDMGPVISTLQNRLYQLHYPRGEGVPWAIGDCVCAVFNRVGASGEGERRWLFEGRVVQFIGSQVRVHWTSDGSSDGVYEHTDVHATREAAFAATHEEDIHRQMDKGQKVQTRASKVKKEEIAKVFVPAAQDPGPGTQPATPKVKKEEPLDVFASADHHLETQQATQTAQIHNPKIRRPQSRLRMMKKDDSDNDRPSLMILGQRYHYLPQAKNHSFCAQYDQQQVTQLEGWPCPELRQMARNNVSPSTLGTASDKKAMLIFKIVCGPYHDDSQRNE